jgi:capsular polysaccharide biosynthesis protein
MQSYDPTGARRFDYDIDWNNSMGKKEYHEPRGIMNKLTLTEFTLQDALALIQELREDVARHEQRWGEKMRAFLTQQAEKVQQVVQSAWMPSHVMGWRDQTYSSYKIRKIKNLSIKQHDIDIVTKLQSTWLAWIYRRYLKRYSAIRWIIQWIWRNGYPFYVNHVAIRLSNWKEKRWRPLTKLSEFVKKSGMQTYKLADAALVETPAPRVFPACDQDYLVSPHDRYEFPEIFVATINNAMTYGGTNLIIADGEVVCHDLYDFKRDYTSEELHGLALIDPKSGRIRWLLHDEAPEPIPVAATFVDACAPNYAHWLTEVLPRVALFCAEDRFHGVPIVVNDGLHKNIMKSLFLVAGADREIITLPIGRALFVRELYLTSVAGYVPFERRTNKLLGNSHGMFSPQAFQILRNYLDAPGKKTDDEAWPEKIFLRRNSGTRKVANASVIEKLLVDQGYVIVEPEKLMFLQQVQLFSNAKTIVGSSGAGLANIIFCPPTTEISIFISKHPDTSYWYWQNIACVSGKTVSYVLGEISDCHLGIHADFMIDLDDLVSFIDREE